MCAVNFLTSLFHRSAFTGPYFSLGSKNGLETRLPPIFSFFDFVLFVLHWIGAMYDKQCCFWGCSIILTISTH